MFLDAFHTDDNGSIHISAEQASHFAKDVAGDFNPIHDPDSKRFCVPGDLLFSLVLAKYGLSQKMHFDFAGMVGDGKTLLFPPSDAARFAIQDDQGKTYLEVEREGAISHDEAQITTLVRDYVAFSGRNFPHILVPLMAEHRVMINPDRPLVIYESMSFDLTTLDFQQPALEQTGSSLDVQGKRGTAQLHFAIRADGKTVGTGFKQLILSGLREYQADTMQQVVDEYEDRKAAYQASSQG
jgi:hypothetical protein